MKRRQHGRTNLDNKPADDRVGDGNLVDIAPLQLGEEIVARHLAAEYRRTDFPLQYFLEWLGSPNETDSQQLGAVSFAKATAHQEGPSHIGNIFQLFSATSNGAPVLARTSSTVTLGCSSIRTSPPPHLTSNTARSARRL